jgi:hypothetical protein
VNETGINCPNGVTIRAGTARIKLMPPPAGTYRPDWDLPILRCGFGCAIEGGIWDCNHAGCEGWFTQGIRFHGKFEIRHATIIGMRGAKESGTPAGAVESFAISSEGDTGGSFVGDCVVTDCKCDSPFDYVSGIFIGATVETDQESTVQGCRVDLGVHGQFAYSSNQPTLFEDCEGEAARFWYNDTGPTRGCRIINCHGTGHYAVISCVATPGGELREVKVNRGKFFGERAVEWWDQSSGQIEGGVHSSDVDYSTCRYHLSSAGDRGALVFEDCLLGDSIASYASETSARAVIIPVGMKVKP